MWNATHYEDNGSEILPCYTSLIRSKSDLKFHNGEKQGSLLQAKIRHRWDMSWGSLSSHVMYGCTVVQSAIKSTVMSSSVG